MQVIRHYPRMQNTPSVRYVIDFETNVKLLIQKMIMSRARFIHCTVM